MNTTAQMKLIAYMAWNTRHFFLRDILCYLFSARHSEPFQLALPQSSGYVSHNLNARVLCLDLFPNAVRDVSSVTSGSHITQRFCETIFESKYPGKVLDYNMITHRYQCDNVRKFGYYEVAGEWLQISVPCVKYYTTPKLFMANIYLFEKPTNNIRWGQMVDHVPCCKDSE